MVFSGVPCNAVQHLSRDVARPHEARRSGCRGLDEILHHEGHEGTRRGQHGARAEKKGAFVVLRVLRGSFGPFRGTAAQQPRGNRRSEEHTSELQSLMRISYAVFCLKKKKTNKTQNNRDKY